LSPTRCPRPPRARGHHPSPARQRQSRSRAPSASAGHGGTRLEKRRKVRQYGGRPSYFACIGSCSHRARSASRLKLYLTALRGSGRSAG
jgi:hypothetical protein